MAIPSVVFAIGSGLNRPAPSDRSTSAMLMQGVATSATSTTLALALGTIIELRSVSDAEAYGLNAAYDTTNKVLVYHHITRFYKRCPGAKLYIKLVSQTTTLTNMCDKTLTHLKELLSSSLAGGRVHQAAVALNPTTSYTATATGGLDGDVLTAATKAQALATEEYALGRPVEIIIEGRQFNGTASAATDLRALGFPNVSVIIAQDSDIANIAISTPSVYKYYAAVGDYLGMIASAGVSQSIGWPARFPLTDPLDGAFMHCGISSNADVATMESSFDTLFDKGYVFAAARQGLSGYYFMGAPVCNSVSDDRAYLENSRTLNAALRVLNAAYAPRINSPIPLSPDGTMTPAAAGELEALGKTALQTALMPDDISGCSVVVDRTHNFITQGEQVSITFEIQPIGVARKITGTVLLNSTLTNNA